MRDHVDSDDEPLIDLTASLSLHSKRTSRLQRRAAKKASKQAQRASLSTLPAELVSEIQYYLRPSDVISLSRTNRAFYDFTSSSTHLLAREIITHRYAILTKCLPLPILLDEVVASDHAMLTNPSRQEILNIHRRPYQHISPPDPHLICTCLACTLAWNNLCLIVDFAHWQRNLDKGDPIPIIPRGENPKWNIDLVEGNAGVVRRAMREPLWYALILQRHLASMVRSIRRHERNMGNKRRKFSLCDDCAKHETDEFLEQQGPPSLEFPFARDEYYLLSAYQPNRYWVKEKSEWRYYAVGQHERDLKMMREWEEKKRRDSDEERKKREEMMRFEEEDWMRISSRRMQIVPGANVVQSG